MPRFLYGAYQCTRRKELAYHGVTYILMRKDCPADVKSTLRNYFMWCYTEGSGMATKLNYVALPQDVVKLVEPTL